LNNIFFVYKLESRDKERQSRGPNGKMTETPRAPNGVSGRKKGNSRKKSQHNKKSSTYFPPNGD
jgi:hypothetical protein